jgi:hypothetical protein
MKKKIALLSLIAIFIAATSLTAQTPAPKTGKAKTEAKCCAGKTAAECKKMTAAEKAKCTKDAKTAESCKDKKTETVKK